MAQSQGPIDLCRAPRWPKISRAGRTTGCRTPRGIAAKNDRGGDTFAEPAAHEGNQGMSGGSCRIRTYDLRIKSPLLYQLS